MAAQVKVEMLTTTVGAKRGDVVSVDKEVADRLIANGKAQAASKSSKGSSE